MAIQQYSKTLNHKDNIMIDRLLLYADHDANYTDAAYFVTERSYFYGIGRTKERMRTAHVK